MHFNLISAGTRRVANEFLGMQVDIAQLLLLIG
jgi:hypothetical protein